MGETVCLDLDEVMNKWAAEKLGPSYVVEKMDTSRLKLQPLSVIYQSSDDWFEDPCVHEEIFHNNEELPITWQFSERVQFQSRATWKLLKGIKSSLVPIPKLEINYPIAEPGCKPLSVTFDSCNPNPGLLKSSEKQNSYNVETYVTLKPFSTIRVKAHMRTCLLENVMFTADMGISGILKVTGHKKRKQWSKQELTAPIDEVLRGNPSFHQVVVQRVSCPRTKRMVFRVEGLCSGEVALAAGTSQVEMETSV